MRPLAKRLWNASFSLRRALLAAISVLIVANCESTYREPGVEELQQSDKVILYRDHPWTEGGICSANIDGRELARDETQIELRPGKHHVSYSCNWPEINKSTYMFAEIDFVEGHRYKLDVDICGFEECESPKEYRGVALTWIEDLTTGKIIHVEPPQ